MSRMEKPKLDLDKDSFHEVTPIMEAEDITAPTLEVPPSTGEGEPKTPGEGTEGDTGEEKPEGEKTEEGEKAKEDKFKDKKLWMDFDDFCKCFGYVCRLMMFIYDVYSNYIVIVINLIPKLTADDEYFMMHLIS